jgi:type IV secretory pathway VirB4 component
MAVDIMVRRLLDERDQKISLIDQIAGVADEAGRDLFETESETIENAQARVRSLNAQVDRLTQDLELADTAKNRIRTLDPNIIAKDFTYRTAGEFMFDLINRSNDSDCHMRLNKFMSRAAPICLWIESLGESRHYADG